MEQTRVRLERDGDIAVIGAGTMGSGIAIAALDAGYEVLLLEQEAAALERGAKRIHEHDASRLASGKLKAGVAAATSRPQDVIGLHFFSPANVMKLMEVVRGKVSAIEALATGLAVGRKLKKLPDLTGYTFGFVGIRLYAAYRGQCEFMVEEGAAPEQVDAALEAFGFAMGPFAVADLSGLDIAWRMRQAQAAKRDPAARSVQIADRRCEAGRLGRKTGAGYYQYPKDASRPQVDLAVPELIAKALSDKGITPRELDAEEIQRRMMLTLVNEAALLLAEGVAERATEVDVVSVNGYGFPRREGGPVFSARARRVAALQADLDELASWSGPGFIRGDVQHLLESKA